MSIGGVQEIKNIEEDAVSLLTLDTGSGSKSTKFMKIMHNIFYYYLPSILTITASDSSDGRSLYANTLIV